LYMQSESLLRHHWLVFVCGDLHFISGCKCSCHLHSYV